MSYLLMNQIKFMLFNATGLRTKYENINTYMKKNEIDISLITETWLKQNSVLKRRLICPSICAEQVSRGMAGTAMMINHDKNKLAFNEIRKDDINGRFSITKSGNLVIVVTYLSPLMNLESVQETLEQIFDIIETSQCNEVLFTGDFNLKHPELGSLIECRRGKYILDIFKRKGYLLANKIGEGEYTNVVRGCQPSIIDLVWTKNIEIQSIKVDNAIFLGNSSHRPVIFTINENENVAFSRIIYRKVLKLESLNDRNIAKELIEVTKNPFCDIQVEIENELELLKLISFTRYERVGKFKEFNNYIDKRITTIICEASEKVCGSKWIAKSSRSNLIENQTTINYQNRLNAIYKLQQKTPNSEILELQKQNIVLELEKEREKIRSTAFEEFALSLSRDKKPKQQKFLKKVVKSRMDSNSELLKNDKEALESGAEYFRRIFTNEQKKNVAFRHDWKFDSTELNEIAESMFSVECIGLLLKYAPKGKAPGVSEISNEVLSILTEVLSPLLSVWFKYCLITDTIPNSWSNTIIVPVYKKGEKSNIENYRPISLLENIRKIFERCIEAFIKENMKCLEIQQGGFREGRSTLDQALCLDEIIKVYKKNMENAQLLVFWI